MIPALITRRFKANGASLVEVARLTELRALPMRGDKLKFEDGTGEAGVLELRISTWYPVAVEIRTCTEAVERLDVALRAGWKLVDSGEELPGSTKRLPQRGGREP